MTYDLRRYKRDDADGVRELILSILAKEYPFEKSAYSDSDLDKIDSIYGGGKNAFFVIDEEGRITGTTGVKEDSREEALLRRVFVDPKARKHGYGSALVDRAVDFCKEKGYKRVYFRCTDRMADAMRLCMKKGFKEVENLEIGGFHIHKLELKI